MNLRCLVAGHDFERYRTLAIPAHRVSKPLIVMLVMGRQPFTILKCRRCPKARVEYDPLPANPES